MVPHSLAMSGEVSPRRGRGEEAADPLTPTPNVPMVPGNAVCRHHAQIGTSLADLLGLPK